MILHLSGMTVEAESWTNTQGRSFEAELIRLDSQGGAIFAFPNGRQFSMPVIELSAADRARINGGGRALPHQIVAASFGGNWPKEVRLDGAVPCKVVSEEPEAHRYIYESPNYRFTSDSRLNEDARRHFVVLFEVTAKYAKSLPISLGNVKSSDSRLDVRIFGSREAYERAGGVRGSAGFFSNGVVIVPTESLGLKQGATGFSVDMRKKNHVLIHELAHQLTPQVYYSAGAKGWFSEGLAEYIATTPYNWGYFRPDASGGTAKAYATSYGTNGTGGRAVGPEIKAPKLRSFFQMTYHEFSGEHANFNYALGLLLTHYFFHMEGNGKAARITKFLQSLHSGQQGEAALKNLLGAGTYEKLEEEISAAWARQGVNIHFGG